ncbi:MAG: ThiF family adenylyltransferase [Sporichthyaceae bacterium]
MRRPVVKSGLRQLTRGPGSVQFGVDPEHAVVLVGLDLPLEGLPAGRLERPTLAALHAAGLLEDAAAVCPGWRALPAGVRDRLEPDLTALGLLDPGADGGRRMLSRRFAAHVEIRGGGRVGASLAALLAAAGVGEVQVVDPMPVRPQDLAPAGLQPASLGRARGRAATPTPLPSATVLAARRARRRPPGLPRQRTRTSRPDLVVLAVDDGPLPSAATLMAARIPHLVAQVHEISATVGPLVVPGRTSCLRCHDLTRADRDPAWPALAAQLAEPGPPEAKAACDVVLATTVACHAALQALAFVESGTAPAVDATLQVRLPDGMPRRRSWLPHPACECTWIG